MDDEEQQDDGAENEDDQGVAVELVGVALKYRAAHVDRGIAGSVRAEEEQEQQPRRSHYQFFANR